MYVFLLKVAHSVTKEQLFIQLVEALAQENLFYGHAVIDAEDEVMMVMMHVFSETVPQILSTGSQEIPLALQESARSLIKQRIKGNQPMAYLVGHVSFAGLEFNCDQRALVPRSPIAELIVHDFYPWLQKNKIKSVLDLCTGSGCIGISIGHYFQKAVVELSDISVDALALAQTNINKHQLNSRVNIVHSDLFASIDRSYSLIVSNPPYVSEAEYQELPDEYKSEPKLGLVTERQGLQIPVEILYQSVEYLEIGGHLILEVGYSDEDLATEFPEIPFQWVDFSNGGQGVCVFSRETLLEYRPYFKQFLTEKRD